MPAGARYGQSCKEFLRPGRATQSAFLRDRTGFGKPIGNRNLGSGPRLVAEAFSAMNSEKLDRFLSSAKDFDASDLHLVSGVPPAFRVNGEIIIADEDALTEEDITRIADSLLN